MCPPGHQDKKTLYYRNARFHGRATPLRLRAKPPQQWEIQPHADRPVFQGGEQAPVSLQLPAIPLALLIEERFDGGPFMRAAPSAANGTADTPHRPDERSHTWAFRSGREWRKQYPGGSRPG